MSAESVYHPISVQPFENDQLMVIWNDDKISLYPYVLLQLSCRCAKCVDELTGEILINESEIDDQVQLKQVMPVGGYGIRFKWSSGCESGIYSFDYLRTLSPNTEG